MSAKICNWVDSFEDGTWVFESDCGRMFMGGEPTIDPEYPYCSGCGKRVAIAPVKERPAQ